MPRIAERSLGRAVVTLTITMLCVVGVTAAVLLRPTWRERVRHSLGWSTQFVVGEPSGLPASLTGDADHTVLIFVSETCAACQRSRPFHRTLLTAANARVAVKILLTTPGGDTGALSETLGAATTTISAFDSRGTRLRVVPTLLIVDRAGTVLEMKEGVLPDAEQHALLELLKSYLP